MKKIIYCFALICIINNSFGQFRVLSNTHFDMSNGRLNIKTNNPTVDIGCDDGSGMYASTIYFWHTVSKWNKLKAYSYIVMSDSNLKTNIMPLENASDVLNNINTYSYSMVDNPEITNYGVLAQELEAILPELVDTTHGACGVNYIGIIPFLIKGFQEKSIVIDDLQNEIELVKEENLSLIEQIENLLSQLGGGIPIVGSKTKNNLISGSSDKAILYQNTPNPFSQNTQIRCFIPQSSSKALLNIYDLQGKELLSYNLDQKGEQCCTINGSDLNAGMYFYTLIVDNDVVDTKRMILTK